jgi:1-acyl-sn-glycerol-3-phosphate acyltransferase
MIVRAFILAGLVPFFLAILAPVLLAALLFGYRDALIHQCRAAIRLAWMVLGCRLEVRGAEHRDGPGPRIYMSNHLSLIDGPLMCMLIFQPVRVILKSSVFRIPVLGPAMRYVGFVPVDRRGGNAGRRSIDRAARSIRRFGYSFLIFPEGTRSRDGRLGRFRRGGFFLAAQSGAAIVPVSIRGTYEILPRGGRLPRRGSVVVTFHRPRPAAHAGGMAELMKDARAAIAAGLEGGQA